MVMVDLPKRLDWAILHINSCFRVGDFFVSEKYSELLDDVRITPLELSNIVALANMLELIILNTGVRVKITSGYRTSRLNALVGGAKDSKHLFGAAVDFTILGGESAFLDGIQKVVGFLVAYDVPFGRLLIHPYRLYAHLELGVDREIKRIWDGKD